MHIGLAFFLTDRTVGVVELARAADERGFYSLYLPEHTHIPVSRETPPPTGDEVLDEGYSRIPDPWISLAAAASVTDRLLLGTGVALPVQHDPIVLAKQLATLDQLSSGRVVFGLGYGWNREEMADHGVVYGQRRDAAREHTLLMQSIWRDEVASFDGTYFSLSPSWSWPKPVQQPRIRTLVGGGAGPKLFAHIAEFADGWMPFGGGGLGTTIPQLERAFEDAGRDPATLQVVPMGVFPDEGKLAHYEKLGVSEVVLRVPQGDGDDVRRTLDDYTRWL